LTIYKNWPNDAKDSYIFTLNNYSIVTTHIELTKESIEIEFVDHYKDEYGDVGFLQKE
jgi:hypothetical protein